MKESFPHGPKKNVMKIDGRSNEGVKDSPQRKGGRDVQDRVEKEDFMEWMMVKRRQRCQPQRVVIRLDTFHENN